MDQFRLVGKRCADLIPSSILGPQNEIATFGREILHEFLIKHFIIDQFYSRLLAFSRNICYGSIILNNDIPNQSVIKYLDEYFSENLPTNMINLKNWSYNNELIHVENLISYNKISFVRSINGFEIYSNDWICAISDLYHSDDFEFLRSHILEILEKSSIQNFMGPDVTIKKSRELFFHLGINIDQEIQSKQLLFSTMMIIDNIIFSIFNKIQKMP